VSYTYYISGTVEPGVRSNEDLIIGTPEYNKVAYYQVGRSLPWWKNRIQFDTLRKERGSWKFTMNRTGGSHPARTRLREDISRHIATNLHLKTKTFEYIPKTGEIKVENKSVGKYDKYNGYLSSFTLKNIDSKLSRYRLRDFGIHLIKNGNKTIWKMKMNGDYYDYIMGIHGNIDGLRKTFKPIFPSIGVDIVIDENTTREITFSCELLNNVVYNTHLSKNTREFNSRGRFANSSDIFHKELTEWYSENWQPRFDITDLSSRLKSSLLYLVEELEDGESKTQSLGYAIREWITNPAILMWSINRYCASFGTPSNKKALVEVGSSKLASTRIILDFTVGIVKIYKPDTPPTTDGNKKHYTFQDLGLEEFIDIKEVSKQITDIDDVIDFTEMTSTPLKIGDFDISKYSYEMSDREYLKPLLGKELLIVLW
jgi:hypothetical protein